MAWGLGNLLGNLLQFFFFTPCTIRANSLALDLECLLRALVLNVLGRTIIQEQDWFKRLNDTEKGAKKLG